MSPSSLVWLASYPKSGNTWMRVLLTNYLQPADGPASINALRPGASWFDRHQFEECIGLPSSALTPDEMLRYRSLFHELVAAELPQPTFVKVHDACIHTDRGELLFPASITAGAIYIVRNPLDVAVSFAHHVQCPIDHTVAGLNVVLWSSSIQPALPTMPEHLSTWSGHVSSWLDQESFPVHRVRYEDLLADPVAEFGAVVRFAGLGHDADAVAQAVDRSRFEVLRDQEARDGFGERMPQAPSFFREGRAGAWRDALSPEQVRAVVDAHAPVMERLGYLAEAEAFLAERRGSRRPPAPPPDPVTSIVRNERAGPDRR